MGKFQNIENYVCLNWYINEMETRLEKIILLGDQLLIAQAIKAAKEGRVILGQIEKPIRKLVRRFKLDVEKETVSVEINGSWIGVSYLSFGTETKRLSDTLAVSFIKENLKKIEIIKLGRKEGKFQNYEIDFDKFLPMFIERAIQEKITHTKDSYPNEIPKLKALAKEKYFKTLVVNYLKNQGMTATLAESARSVEDALKLITFDKRKAELNDKNKAELFNKLLEWKNIAKEKRTLPEANFLDAFSKIFYKHKKLN